MRISSFKDEDQMENEIPTYKIILLGVSQAGKSKLLTRYIYGSFESTGLHTHGIDCSYVKKRNARFAYFDTAGQERYRTILNMYFKGSDAAILVYSTNNLVSLREMNYYKQRIEEEEPECKLYVFGCKGDLQRTVASETVSEKYPGVKLFVTSAKTGLGVNQAFGVIESDLLRSKKIGKSFLSRPIQPFSAISVRQKQTSSKGDCCL